MPLEFPALLRGKYPESVPTVEGAFTAEDLAQRLVVWCEATRRYFVFSGPEEFFAWQEGQPPSARCYHEVVFGQQAQRLKFDVDAPAAKLLALPPGWASALDGGPAPAAGAALSSEELASLLGWHPAAGACPEPAPAPEPATDQERARARSLVLLGLLAEAILDELYSTYCGLEDIRPTREDLVVADSSGPTADGWKESFHVLVHPYGVANNEEAREFTERVLGRLPPLARKLVDPGVNKRIQNFRMAGSAKAGTARVKRLSAELASQLGTAGWLSERDLLVRAPAGARVLARTCDGSAEPAGFSLGAESELVRAALELAGGQGVLAGHKLEAVRGTLLCFAQDARPGAGPGAYCRIHREVHHRDNFLLVGIHPDPCGHSSSAGRVACQVVEYCRQARGEGRPLGTVWAAAAELRAAEGGRAPPARKAKPPRPPAETVSRIAERLAELRGGADPHEAAASAFEALPAAQQTVYAEPAMRPYELVPTLAVRAQMKLGKTKALGRYLGAHYPAGGLAPRVIRFVTFRQTFSRSLAEAFPDFTHYSDVAGDLDAVRHPRLIVQVESLHRLRHHPEPVDLVILDEVESILEQFNSGLHRNFNAAFAMFQVMLRSARRVICMDANLGDRTFRTLARMRPGPVHFHWNREARAAGDRYFLTADQGAWLERLYEQVRAGRRVVLPTNSLGEAKAFEEALRREFPDKAVRLYSSETAPSEKARHFSDVHTHWGGLDVLIFTPTCSAGVSFELPHFDALFAYFCDASCSVETCRQMLGRVRQLSTREHYVCLRATGASLPATPEALRRLLYDKRAGLFRTEGFDLQFEYEPETGGIVFYESDFFHLYLENACVANLSRNDFVRRFVDQVADTGASLEQLAGVLPAAGAALLLGHRELRDELRAARCDAVAAADDLTLDEAAAVREAITAQRDVEPARRLAFEKFLLRDAYSWHGRPLDAAFVEAYQSPAAKRVYRNLCRITAAPSVGAALERIRQREAEHYGYALSTRSEALGQVNESRDLLRDRALYVYQSHALANWILGVCGLRLAEPSRVHADLLEARLRGALEPLSRSVDRLVFEFEVPRVNFAALAGEGSARFLAGTLRPINAVLRAMYGVQVQKAPKRSGGHYYSLALSPVGRLFVFSDEPEPDDAPGGPRPHIPSQLLLADAAGALDAGQVSLFLEDAYYAAPAAEFEPSPEPSPAAEFESSPAAEPAPPAAGRDLADLAATAEGEDALDPGALSDDDVDALLCEFLDPPAS